MPERKRPPGDTPRGPFRFARRAGRADLSGYGPMLIQYALMPDSVA